MYYTTKQKKKGMGIDMKKLFLRLQRLFVGIIVCTMLVMSAGGNVPFSANAAQENQQNKGNGVIKNKKVKNNKRNVNCGNATEKAWNHKMIQLEQTEESGKVVKVAIIDSGVNYSSDINVVVRKNFIEDDECSILYEDISGHGTAIAGLIGAIDNEEGITGINPRVELYSARVLDDRLEAPIDRVVEAIDWAVEQNCDIINLSFGVSDNILELEQAIERADAAGILMIAAVGNGEEIAYPAAYDEVMAVGSVTMEGIPSYNSAKGSALEIMAPGNNILASGVFDGVLDVSGTSFAVPHVVGAASVLMEKNPEMPADYIRDLLNYSANLYGSQSEYGNGVLDLSYALEINDDFKKLYNKYIDREEKNQKQKEKQKNKFWGKVLKEIPENEKAVEIFTGIEIVEGMWGKNDHMGLVNFAGQATGLSFTQEQMKILLYACKYPDISEDLAGMYPYHGYVWRESKKEKGNSNYLANYIYLTKIAANAGNTSGLSQTGLPSVDKARIDADISTTHLGSEEWADVFKQIDGNIAATEGNIKLFLYGIAMHHVGDVFAHSAWADFIHPLSGQDGIQRIKHWKKDDGSYEEISADKIDAFPKRYDAAKQVMKNVIGKAYSSSVGTINDFAISTYYCGNTDTTRFYLGNLLQYAFDADPAVYNSWVNANSICINEYRYLDLQNNCTDYFFD